MPRTVLKYMRSPLTSLTYAKQPRPAPASPVPPPCPKHPVHFYPFSSQACSNAVPLRTCPLPHSTHYSFPLLIGSEFLFLTPRIARGEFRCLFWHLEPTHSNQPSPSPTSYHPLRPQLGAGLTCAAASLSLHLRKAAQGWSAQGHLCPSSPVLLD